MSAPNSWSTSDTGRRGRHLVAEGVSESLVDDPLAVDNGFVLVDGQRSIEIKHASHVGMAMIERQEIERPVVAESHEGLRSASNVAALINVSESGKSQLTHRSAGSELHAPRQMRDAGMGANRLCCLKAADSEIQNETASFQNEKGFSQGLHLTRRDAWRVACLGRGGQGVIA